MTSKRTRLPKLNGHQLGSVIATLTTPRMGRYLTASQNDRQQALRLYIFNTKISSAAMADIHFVEVVLRNKFDRELSSLFGAYWFTNPTFLRRVNGRAQSILQKAQQDAGRLVSGPPSPGKVIAELTLGFWNGLTDRRYEHQLWTPCLHKSFAKQAPRRSTFNERLEKIRQLRNRVAHHEPIFHLDLLDAHKVMVETCALLCPITAELMRVTSEMPRTIKSINKYKRRRNL